MTTPAPPETPQSAPDQPPDEDPGWFEGLRGPRGCAEWTVVILGVIWVVRNLVTDAPAEKKGATA